MVMNTLAHHDRVIDDDPQHQKKCKQRQEINRHVDQRQKDKSPDEGDGNAYGDPDRHLKAKR